MKPAPVTQDRSVARRLPLRRIALLATLAGAVGLSTLSGCTTRGVASRDRGAALSTARCLDLDLRWNGKIAVLHKADRSGVTGVILLGLPGAAMEQGIRASEDERTAEKLRARVGDWDGQARAEQRLLEILRESGRFQSVTARGSGTPDARLQVTIEHAGILPCFRRDSPKDHAQVGIHYLAKLLSADSRTTVWELRDICLQGQERPLADFYDQPELVRTGLNEAIEQLAHRLSNGIRLATQPNR